MNFLEKLDKAVEKNNSLVCVGLDPDTDKLPGQFKNSDNSFFEFNKAIIDATADLVCCFKPNSAFYEALGSDGIQMLEETCDYIREKYPAIPILLDFKRGDIGNTNQKYAQFAFDYLEVDAVTLHPFFGRSSLQAFLDFKDKGMVIMIKSSNDDSSELQDLKVEGGKLFEHLAFQVKTHWNENENCLLMVGATYPRELASVRKIAGDKMQILVPGVGAQGGVAEMLKAGLNSQGRGLIVSASRSVLYASNKEDFADAARQAAEKLKTQINQFRP
ncbi:orotidine-5'-phosphate decarboxylase [Candidatus Parcubacteria bacterium]|nr:orotidine-5'-phosphate decarboxylase [Candidatus Parcubacteria bacterium]